MNLRSITTTSNCILCRNRFALVYVNSLLCDIHHQDRNAYIQAQKVEKEIHIQTTHDLKETLQAYPVKKEKEGKNLE